jgi:hypothetical protein
MEDADMSEDRAEYKTNGEREVPAGYMQDARGRLVPVENVSERDLLCDDLVEMLMAEAVAIATSTASFKDRAFEELDAFIQLSNEKYGVRTGGQKGNAALTSFDGRIKVVVDVDEGIAFGEQLQAARELIDECIVEWSANVRPELVVLINDAFRAARNGKLSTARVLGLLRLDIKHPKWELAMKALADAVQVTGSKRYLRFYRRRAPGAGYEQIPLG